MDKSTLEKYIEILKQVENGQELSNSDYQTKYLVEKNLETRELVKAINETKSDENRYKLINDYYNKTSNKSIDEKIEELIKKEYGLDLVNIDHMKLQSGIDVIAFYDDKIGRKRIIDYSNAKSLVEEFTNIQNSNKNFQTDNFQNNTDLIAKAEATKNINKELDMIDINRAKNEYFELMKRVKDNDPTKIQSINEIIKEAEKRNIKFINFENMIALDENGNIIESFYNSKTDKYELETPEKIDTSVNSVDNKSSIDEEVSSIEENILEEQTDETPEIIPTSFEMEEDIKEAEAFDNLEEGINLYHMNCSREQAIENIKRYSENMTLLDDDLSKNQITQEEYEFYESYCQKYINLKEQKLNKVKTLEYNPSRGIVSVIIISVITIIMAIIALIIAL